MKNEFISAIKNYKFTTFNPFLTFSDSNRSFINNNGASLARYDDFHQLFYLGKKAYDLLEIESEDNLKKLCHGYFVVVIFLLDIGIKEHKRGRLKFRNYEGESLINLDSYEDVYKNPDIYNLIAVAPSLLRWGFELGEEINRQLPPDDIDILNDVYMASLIHTLIEIDNAICAFDLGSPGSLIATQEATQSYEYAQAVKRKIESEKSLRIAKARFAANKRHEKTTRAKDEIRRIWATGKYSSRDICAEQECANLNISFSTARKALRNTPEPTEPMPKA